MVSTWLLLLFIVMVERSYCRSRSIILKMALIIDDLVQKKLKKSRPLGSHILQQQLIKSSQFGAEIEKGGVISDLSLRMTLLSPDWKCREQKQQKIDINLAENCSRERNLSFLSAGLYPLFTLFHINQRTRTDRGSNTFVPCSPS